MPGQTMGVPSEGGTSDKVVSLVLAGAGLDPQHGRRVVGLAPSTFDLVQQGRIVGYAVSIDTANILTAQNPDAGAFDPTEYVRSGSQLHATTKEGLTKEADNPRAFLAAIHEAMALDPKKPPLVTDEAAGAAGYKELTDAGLLPPGGDPKSWFDNSLLPKS